MFVTRSARNYPLMRFENAEFRCLRADSDFQQHSRIQKPRSHHFEDHSALRSASDQPQDSQLSSTPHTELDVRRYQGGVPKVRKGTQEVLRQEDALGQQPHQGWRLHLSQPLSQPNVGPPSQRSPVSSRVQPAQTLPTSAAYPSNASTNTSTALSHTTATDPNAETKNAVSRSQTAYSQLEDTTLSLQSLQQGAQAHQGHCRIRHPAGAQLRAACNAIPRTQTKPIYPQAGLQLCPSCTPSPWKQPGLTKKWPPTESRCPTSATSAWDHQCQQTPGGGRSTPCTTSNSRTSLSHHGQQQQLGTPTADDLRARLKDFRRDLRLRLQELQIQRHQHQPHRGGMCPSHLMATTHPPAQGRSAGDHRGRQEVHVHGRPHRRGQGHREVARRAVAKRVRGQAKTGRAILQARRVRSSAQSPLATCSNDKRGHRLVGLSAGGGGTPYRETVDVGSGDLGLEYHFTLGDSNFGLWVL